MRTSLSKLRRGMRRQNSKARRRRPRPLACSLGFESLEHRRLLATLDINPSDHLQGSFADLTISRVGSDYHFTDATDTITLTGDALLDCTTITTQQVSCPVAAVSSIDITAQTILVSGDIQTTGDISLLAQAASTSATSDVQATLTVASVLIQGANISLEAETALNVSESGSNFERIAKIVLSLEVPVAASALVTINDSTINATGDVTVTAATTVNAGVTAEADADANTARDASIAIALIDSLAVAEITGSTSISLTGTLRVAADNDVLLATLSDGTANGPGIGGASLGLSVLHATTLASLRDGAAVSGAADIAVEADANLAVSTKALATAKGATEGTPGDSRSENELAAHGAETSEGQITHAAAVALANVQELTTAEITTSGSVQSGGSLLVQALSNHDLTTSANASSVDSSEANLGVGVAVAINRLEGENRASVGGSGQLVAASPIIVRANQSPADTISQIVAEAVAGAGANVGVAGSLAMNLVTYTSEALVGGGATLDFQSSDLELTSGGNSRVYARSVAEGNEDENNPGSGSSPEVGVGASVALNLSNQRTRAAVDDSATPLNVRHLTIDAAGVYDVFTVANGGSQGGLAFTPVVATTIANHATQAEVAAGSLLAVSGDLVLQADHTDDVASLAQGDVDGLNAAIGASLALTVAHSIGLATIARDVTADGAIHATSRKAGTAATRSLASATGAEGDDGIAGSSDDDAVNQQLQEQRDFADQVAVNEGVDGSGPTSSPSAENSDGTLSVAAAVSLSIVEAVAAARVQGGVTLVAGGQLTLESWDNTDVTVQADASSTMGTTGIGAAASLSLATITNTATVEPGADVTAAGVTLSAGMQNLVDDQTHTLFSEARSGASADTVGVAGALSIAIVRTDTTAALEGGSTTDADGADANLFAASQTDSTSRAVPLEQITSGESLGVGASVAIHIVDHSTRAEVEDDAALIGTHDLNLDANSNQTTTTSAIGGAEGGTAITPVVAISLVNSSSLARLGTLPGTTTVGGAITATADHVGRTTTTAEGDAEGANAAFGASLALATANDTARATTQRNLAAGGSIGFVSTAHTDSTAHSSASATGAEGDDGVPNSSDDDMVEQQVQSQLDVANDTATDNGAEDSGTSTAPETETSDGKLSVAAAITVNLVDSRAASSVGDNVTLVAGGDLLVASSHNADARSTSDASAMQADTGIAAAVTFSRVEITNTATVEPGADVTAAGVTLSAGMQDLVDDQTHTLFSEARSGASADTVGVAGALSIAIVRTDTSAALEGGSTTDADGGDANLVATSQTDSTSRAVPLEQITSGESLGVGASVAIHIVDHSTRAEVEDDAALIGTHDLNLDASSNQTTTTTAIGGAEGGTAITPVVAISLVNSSSLARLGTLPGTTTVGGNITAAADHVGRTTTTAEGDAEGASAAFGASLALATANDTARATTERNLAAGGSIGFVSTAHTDSTAHSSASATGAEGDDGVPNSSDDDMVEQQVQSQLDVANDTATNNGAEDSGTATAPETETSDGKLSVAAAITVNLIDSRAASSVGDNVTLVAGGDLLVASSHNADARSTSDASAMQADTGIAAAVTFSRVEITNTATVEPGADVTAAGVTLSADMQLVGRDSTHEIWSEAKSGAGASNVGVAGSLAISLVQTNTLARIEELADVDADAGDTTLKAIGRSLVTTRAVPLEHGTTGESLGVGASAAIAIINHDVVAEVVDDAVLDNTADLTLTADSNQQTLTEAVGGTAGGVAITPVVAISLVDNDVAARVGSSTTAVTASGNVSLNAWHTAGTWTSAAGDAEGTNAAIGAALALAVPRDTVTAALHRDLQADGAVSLTSSSHTWSDGYAWASARGAAGDDGITGSSDDAGVNDQVDAQRSFVDGVATGNSLEDTGAASTPSAETSDGTVSVAAAVSVNIVTTQAWSQIADNVSVVAGGQLSVLARHNADALSNADGQATNGKVGIGAAVALNRFDLTNVASIGSGATIQADGVSVRAETQPIGLKDSRHRVVTLSTAGAGGQQLGVAGSVAIALIDTLTEARIQATTSVTFADGPDSDTMAGSLDMAASELMLVSTHATISGSDNPDSQVGIGASFALSRIDNRIASEVEDGVVFSGAAAKVGMVTVSTHDVTTLADAGAVGGTAVAPAVALSVIENDVDTRLGTGNVLVTLGTAGLQTAHTNRVTTNANADAAGSRVGVGAAVAIAVIDDRSDAETYRDLQAASAITVHSDSLVLSWMEAKGSQQGNQSSGSHVDDEADHQASGSSQTGLGSGALPAAEDSTDHADSTTTSQAGAGSRGVGVAAAVAVNVVTVANTARVADGVSVTTDDLLSVMARRETDLITKANASALSFDGDSNIGAAVGLNKVHATNQALVGSNAVLDVGALNVAATVFAKMTDDYLVHALGGGVGTGRFGIAGSVAINLITSDTDAELGAASDTLSASDASLLARVAQGVQTVAGGVGIGEQAGIGAGVAVTIIDNQTDALVDQDALVDAAQRFEVVASASLAPISGTFPQDPFAFAAGAGASAGAAGIAGSVVVNDLELATRARLGNQVEVNQRIIPALNQDVAIRADDWTNLKNGAGALGGAIGSVGFGAGVDVTLLDKSTLAQIGDTAQVQAARDVFVEAAAHESVLAFAAAVGFGGSVGIAGAAVVHLPTTRTYAGIESSLGNSSEVHAGRTLLVSAGNSADYDLYAGALGIGLQAASVGASNTTLLRHDVVEAYAGRYADLAAAGDIGLRIEADSTEDILTIAVGGSGSGSVGVAGSATVNDLYESTRAFIDVGSQVDATGSHLLTPPGIAVVAHDATDLLSLAGSIGLGGTLGIGAGADVGLLNKHTVAFIAADVTAVAENDILVQADSVQDLASVSAAAAIGGSVGIMGSASVYDLDIYTRAFLGDDPSDKFQPSGVTNIHAYNNIHVDANDQTEVDLIVGNIGGAGSVSVGAAGGITTMDKTVEAFVGDRAIVTAEAWGKGIVAKTGGFRVDFVEPGMNRLDEVGLPPVARQANLDANQDAVSDVKNPSFSLQRAVTPETGLFHGLAVTAWNRDDIESIVVSGSAAGAVAVNVAGGVHTGNVDTRAYIGQYAIINGSLPIAGDQQSVRVVACSDYYRLGISGVGAGAGTVAVGPGVDVGVTHYDTVAEIRRSALVNAQRDVLVVADAAEHVLSISAGLAVSGVVSIAGSVSTLKIDNLTQAQIGRSADINARGNALVAARDETDADMFTGSAAIGIGAGGLSASVGVVTIEKDTDALVAQDALVDGRGFGGALSPILAGAILPAGFATESLQGVAVQAESRETLQNFAVAGGGGVYFGIAGGVAVTMVDSQTSAQVGRSARINTEPGETHQLQSVSVAAANQADVTTFAGGISGGFVGLAGGIDVGNVRNDVTAQIDTLADVRALRDIDVNALSIKHVDGFTLGGTLGVVGLAASVSVWSLGTPLDKIYTDQNNASPTNPLQQGPHVTETYAGSQVAGGSVPISSTLSAYGPGTSPNSVRVDSAMQSASGLVAGRTPTQGQIVSTINNSSTPLGIRAIVADNSSLLAGNDISVRALEDVDYEVTAGGVGIGVVGGGASVVVSKLASNTSASISGFARTGNDVRIVAGLTEDVQGTALAGGAGLVALGAAVTQIKDFSTQRAFLGNGGFITNADDVLISATATQKIAGESDQAQIGAAALGAAFNRLIADGSALAYVGNAAIGGAKIGAVNDVLVLADVDLDVDAQATAIVGGLGLGGSANFAYSEVTPLVRAYTQGGADIDVLGGVEIRAESAADADANLRGFTVGGLTIGTMFTRANMRPDVESYVTGGAQIVAQGGSIVVRALHNVTPGGTALANVVTASSDAPGGGVGSFNGAIPRAFAIPQVNSYVSNGAWLSAGGDVQVAAEANNPAQALANAFTVGLIGGGTSFPTAQSSGAARAHLDGDVYQANHVMVRARNENEGQATGEASAFGLVAGTGSVTLAEAKGTTQAYIPASASLGSVRDVTIESLAENFADSVTNGAAGGLLAIGLVRATADSSGTTHAWLAANLNLTGSLSITARSTDDAAAETRAANGGIISGLGTASRADARPVVLAWIANNTQVRTEQDVQLLAHGFTDADAFARGVSGGLFQVGKADAKAYTATTLDASVGRFANLQAGRDLLVRALHNYQTSGLLVSNGARAHAETASGQLIGLDGADADAYADGSVSARFDIQSTSVAGRNLLIQSHSFHNATALAEGDTFGLGVKGSVDANADARGVVQAYVGNDSDLEAGSVQAGNLNVEALAFHEATADADAASGGVISIKGAAATATAQPTVRAYLGQRNDVLANGSVDVLARALGQAAADATGRGGGVVDVGSSDATATWQPSVVAYLGLRSDVDASQDVSVRGLINHNLSGSIDSARATTASANTSQGALLGSTGATSVANSIASVLAYTDEHTLVNAGRDVLIQTRSGNIVDARTDGQAFGFATKGRTDARTTITNLSRVTVGRDAQVHSDRDVILSSNSDLRVRRTEAIGGAGGLLNIAGAKVKSTVTNETTTLVDDRALICAYRHVIAEALTQIDVNAFVRVETTALITANESEADVDIVSLTTVEIDRDALVHAITGDVRLVARVTLLDVDAESSSRSLAAINTTKAQTYVDVISTAKVYVRTGADVYAGTTIQIVSRHDNVDSDSIARARIIGFTGIVRSHAHHNLVLRSDICVESGSTLNAPNHVFDAFSPTSSGTYNRVSDATGDTIVNYIVQTIQTVKSVLSKIPLLGWIIKQILCWVTQVIEQILYSDEEATVSGAFSSTSNVMIDGQVNQSSNHVTPCTPQPPLNTNVELRVGINGTLLASRNILPTLTDRAVLLPNIVNQPLGRVVILAPNGTVSGRGSIRLRNQFDSVTIVNESDLDLQLGEIRLQPIIGEPQFTMLVGQDESQLQLLGPENVPQVVVHNLGSGQLILGGPVVNPEGIAELASPRGGVQAVPGASIEAATIQIMAGNAHGGLPGAPLVLRPVNGQRPGQVLVDGGNLNLEVHAVEYQFPGDDGQTSPVGSVQIDRVQALGQLQLTLAAGELQVGAVHGDEGEFAFFQPAVVPGSYDLGQVRSVQGPGQGQVVVDRNAVLTGGQQIGTVVNVHAGGSVSPPAGQTVNAGNTHFAPGSSFVAQLGEVSSSQLAVTGQVQLEQPVLLVQLQPGAQPRPGSEFVIVQNDGGDPVAGQFANLTEGATLDVPGPSADGTASRLFRISYRGGDGNDVALRYLGHAGGPYAIREGQALALHAEADFGGGPPPTRFEWDLDNDGVFELATAQPDLQLSWEELTLAGWGDGPRQGTIMVRVSNAL
ncbi:MAG: hypothetical protein J5I93_25985, partial [Pirellulaceae bacterium]|nr:hypothetical protein [Pirellulaceae bacterium]